MELYYIWLECIKGLGPNTWHNMICEYGSPDKIYQNRSSLVPGGKVTRHHLEFLHSGAQDAAEEAKKILERCKELAITIITYDDPKYAVNIKGYPDFPILFYVKGEIREDWTYGVGIVGARRCSAKGKECAIQTSLQMSRDGYPIISGMAKGIDSYAHTAAINNDGYTVAVLGHGLDLCYPVEHKGLMGKIVEKGLVISEYPPGTLPCRFNFPRRNRIIAGLSDILYVIDAGKKSGTRTTIQAAKRYGKIIREIDKDALFQNYL